MRQAHTPQCRFQKGQWSPVLADWKTYFAEKKAGIVSRKCLYLNAYQIFSQLLASAEQFKDRIEFNLPERMHELKKHIAGEESLNQIISEHAPEADSALTKCVLLALTGWRCIPAEQQLDED